MDLRPPSFLSGKFLINGSALRDTCQWMLSAWEDSLCLSGCGKNGKREEKFGKAWESASLSNASKV
ncbi:uncharacterized protein G2W53_016877 [Senna tora]|uniref:Uncharacterized protein n=1 Tax=Senna tora TaxID=362788 RepID=A0A834TNV7_9FABA|nr:uncharacterized protein G2W53_016877 [Senna tora]